MVWIDIACTTVEDVGQAIRGSTNSIEISVDLAADGLTPPLPLLADIYRTLEEIIPRIRGYEKLLIVNTHVILRPHNRDFVYTTEEKMQMLAQAAALSAWCDGFVIGGLLPDGRFDIEWIYALHTLYRDHTLTLHRALDHCNNPLEALRDLRGIANRVLASGSITTAWEGRDTLRGWVQQFGRDYSFVAAGDVNHSNIGALVAYTGVHECHAARAVRRDGVVAADLVKSLRAAVT